MDGLQRLPGGGEVGPADAPRRISSPGPNIGLVWAGEPRPGDDRKRSLTLELLAPLGETPGATFYSL